jgi:hypothetical protein
MQEKNSTAPKRIIVIATLAWIGIASMIYLYQFEKIFVKVFQLLMTF